jgi:lipoprotein-anchoring transpeptidase ErfK/SrfK
MFRRTPTRILILSLAAGLSAVILSACAPAAKSGSATGAARHSATTALASIAAPLDGQQNAGTRATIAYHAGSARSISVTLTDQSGAKVPLIDGYDPETKVPAQALAYGSTYTATVTSTTAAGTTGTSTSTFRTAPQPAHVVSVRSNIGSGQTYGIAVPVVLTFNHKIAQADRAEVQKHLSVVSSPAQTGTWSWFSDHEVHYRPKVHWQPGTTIQVHARTAGVGMGGGYVGRNDLTVDTAITKSPMTITINAKTHLLTLTKDGRTRTMPASLGKPSTPSSSGNMVVMVRHTQDIFDSSRGVGGTPVNAPGGYRELVHWTMRLTWGGEFIHAAPWSVAQQGHTNVSHGCTNVSTANAKWIYQNSLVGDPVTVTGTPRSLQWGNGWTDWDRSWSQYITGSALPVQG